MPMFATRTGNAFLIASPEGAFLDQQWTTDFLEGCAPSKKKRGSRDRRFGRPIWEVHPHRPKV